MNVSLYSLDIVIRVVVINLNHNRAGSHLFASV